MRIEAWVLKTFIDLAHQAVRDAMFQAISFVVDFVPWIVQLGDKQQFQQTVSPNHIDRESATLLGEVDPVVFLMANQTAFVQSFGHARN